MNRVYRTDQGLWRIEFDGKVLEMRRHQFDALIELAITARSEHDQKKVKKGAANNG